MISAPPPSSFLRRERGVALVIVLAIIVLITALIVGFLVRAGVDRSATTSYFASVSARQLGDVAVNVVQGQINDATTQGAGTTWASQPGALRVFDSSGAMKTLYRLYSAGALTTANAADVASDAPPGAWAASPAVWADLNAPVTVQGVKDASGKPFEAYPILDPRDPANPAQTVAIEGFSIDSAPGATADQPAPMPVRWLYVLRNGQIISSDAASSGTVATFSGSVAPTAANPIVGRIAFWTDDETCKVNINTAAGSRRIDPNGGKEADGSPKTLPAPWDTPRFKIWDELRLFSQDQPVHYEYQRYPGHPATTDLYGIFRPLGISMTGYPYPASGYLGNDVTSSPNGAKSALFDLLPRYGDAYSSAAGTRNTTATSGAPPVVLNSNRLFTSFAEMMYDPQRNPTGISRAQVETGKFFLTASSRAPDVNLFGTPRVSMWPIDVSPTKRTAFDNLISFCTTTGSNSYSIQRSDPRSPTADYDGIPRNQQLYGYLANLTSKTVPGYGGSLSAKYKGLENQQILTEMFDYIRSTNLYDHSVPTSNTTFVRYTSDPKGLPGGLALVAPLKIGSTRGLGRAQTISELGIQIICTADGNSPLGPYQAPETVAGKKVSPVKGSANDPLYVSNLPEAQFLRDANGIIIGWDPAQKKVLGGSANTPPGSPYAEFPANQTLTSTGVYGGPLAALNPGQRRLQAMLLFELACPTMGYDGMDLNNHPAYQLQVSGIHGVEISLQNPFPNRQAPSSPAGPNLNGDGTINLSSRVGSIEATGGLLGFRYPLMDHQLNASWVDYNGRYNGWSGQSPSTNGKTSPYPFVSNPFTVDSSKALTLGGGFTAKFVIPTVTGTATYQTFDVTFPALSNLPQPDLPKTGITNSIAADWWGFDARIYWAASPYFPISTSEFNVANPHLDQGCVIRSDVPVADWNYALTAPVPLASFTTQNGASFAGSDVVRTLVAKDGDYRLTTAVDSIDTSGSYFAKGPGYDDGVKLGNLFKDQMSALDTPGVDDGGKLVQDAKYSWQLVPKVPSTLIPAKQQMGDWDSGLPWEPDGAYSNKPDEGNTYNNSAYPYYNREQQGQNIESYFTANRIIPSAGMFGSLPTGVQSGVTWRTLLLRPQASRPQDEIGVKDYLYLDLFTMPVVEPYAISEPYSTAGRVNMNYQIVPFTYINRDSSLRAVLKSELVTRIPKAAAQNQNPWNQHTYYKPTELPTATPSTPPGAPSVARLPLNLDEETGTLRQFTEKFNSLDIFKSPMEIFDIYLTPEGYSWPDNKTADTSWYGDDFSLVGDNVRERPYADIYPRLTTKSNIYTVHYTVQALKNLSSNPAQWDETRGKIIGEYRGSTTIERFLDPNNPNIPDYADGADPTSKDSLEKFYQWRVIANRRFYP